MNMKNLFNRTLALVCAVLMMISLFALPAFAHEDHDHDHAEEAVQEGLSTAAIVWIVIGGVLVVAGVVLGIKYREKIAKALRVYKSEFKKVSWLSWKDTKKNKKNDPDRIELKKYCRFCRKHTVHKESK